MFTEFAKIHAYMDQEHRVMYIPKLGMQTMCHWYMHEAGICAIRYCRNLSLPQEFLGLVT